MTYEEAQALIAACTNVKQLADELNDIKDALIQDRDHGDSSDPIDVRMDDFIDFETLPVWGEYDLDTMGIWSWDPNHTLEIANDGKFVACAR